MHPLIRRCVLATMLAAPVVAAPNPGAASGPGAAPSAGAAARPAATPALGDLSKVGRVDLTISCDPASQPEFDRGLALLHSFFYEEARRVFTDITRRDPECAMAWWGVAMTYYHPMWTAPDSTELAAGRAAAERALAIAKQTPRERGFVKAIAAYYQGLDDPILPVAEAAPSCHGATVGDPRGRAACFSREMEAIATHNPDDVEAAAFYALSLVATATPGDPALANQRKAASLLEKWYAKMPDHPGLAHYIIHSCDYPPLAAEGLTAANSYATIAPWVPHALHMPSHIYTRLGMWEQTIAANRASAQASRAYEAEHHPGAASFEELHALDYLAYAYLQTAQDSEARAVLERVRAVKRTHPASDFVVAYAFGAIPARIALERRQWKEAARLELPPAGVRKGFPFSEGLIEFARAVGAARSGDVAAASAAADRLDALSRGSTDPRFRYFADQMLTQRDAVRGLIAVARGDRDGGIALLRAAAARDDSLGKHPVSPGSILPVRELLAEALLDAGRAAEAEREFEASLRIYPKRFNGVAGAASAAQRAGNREAARRWYGELLDLSKPGDGAAARPEIARARSFMAAR